MEEFPEFRFLASQAAHYAFVEEDSPALFEKVRARVEEGRWEAGGAMWVEADANCPSGESLVRQILHGATYWKERFGGAAPQAFLWLPDTFGFPACLPQIMKGAGLETFVTNKMSWCERNRFPFTTFLWRGIDGTEVLAHLTPGEDYNAALEPAELLRGEARLLESDARPVGPRRLLVPRWLQPFGYGDGGGGPTRESVQRARLARKAAGLPQVEMGRVDAFCRSLHEARRKSLQEGGPDLPAWEGELYLENHRGTLTSQAWLKAANARAERRLRALEAMAACLPQDAGPVPGLRPRLEETWKAVLLHQFHDILPGSSIAKVYEDAREAYKKIEDDLAQMEKEVRGALEGLVDTSGLEEPVLVFNPVSRKRSALLRLQDRTLPAEDLPPLSVTALEGATRPAPRDQVQVQGTRMENGFLLVEIGPDGWIARLEKKGAPAPVNAGAPGPESGLLPLGALRAYEDRPRRWEAWDVDFDYEDKPIPVPRPDKIQVLEAGPLRGAIRVERRFRASAITQTFFLEAGSPRVDVETQVDWREERTLLRALFPTRIRAAYGTFGIQFGHVLRPTHRNTSWEEARFEAPGHKWMDLSQPGLGLAVLDDGTRFGRSCLAGTLGLSLLRGPRFPDPGADKGKHSFRYALLPHDGDWRKAEVPEEADALCDPLVAWKPGQAQRSRGLSGTLQPFRLDLPWGGSVEIAAFKPAHRGKGRVLRLVERHGAITPVELTWLLGPARWRPADLLERPVDRKDFQAGPDGKASFTLRPFEISTLLLEDLPAGESAS